MSALPLPAIRPFTLAPDQLAAVRERFMKAWSECLDQARKGSLPPLSDPRFRDEAWSSSPAHLYAAHVYLLVVRALDELVDAAEVDDDARERLRFAVMQWVDALSPANFLISNPQAQKKAVETGGLSLLQGMQLLLADLNKGRMSQSDESAFEVGVNVAATPGHVVFENPLMQLIQYTPLTDTVWQKPLLMVPPCINKFYILDLQAHNSFVRYALEQGFTVFLVSWRNPLPEDSDGIQNATWGDYLQQGVLRALDVVSDISGREQVNALGFCVGGTLLASALAVAHAQGRRPASTLTLLTSFLDFSDTGILDVFVDEASVLRRDLQLGQGGLMPASELASTFSFLRPNELVWNYVVSSYLLGEAPRPFDLLFWNADSTNLPGPFFAWYFRNAYLENNFIKPGHLSVDGVPIDLARVDVPAYLYASREDHIVPWESAHATTRILPDVQRFVLGASGHVAGVINPPSRNRRHYWVYDEDKAVTGSESPAQWLEGAPQHQGSWWPDWAAWLAERSGPRVAAPAQAGDARYTAIEPAPGRYVKVRAVR
ncbi:MAG: class I poly(R)-hydroxyalkanoic acid synthase [Castellaniella sp.]